MVRSHEMQRESSLGGSVLRMVKQEGGELALVAVDEDVARTPKTKNTIAMFMTSVIGPPADGIEGLIGEWCELVRYRITQAKFFIFVSAEIVSYVWKTYRIYVNIIVWTENYRLLQRICYRIFTGTLYECRREGAAARVDELFDVRSVLINWEAQLFSGQDKFSWTLVARGLALLPCRVAMKTVLIVSDFFGVYMVFLIFYIGILPGCKTARI